MFKWNEFVPTELFQTPVYLDWIMRARARTHTHTHTHTYIYIYIYTWMLRAILNKSWRQHATKHQLYGYLPPITKTIKVRRTRHAGHHSRSRDEIMWCSPMDPLTWPSKSRATSSNLYNQLCEDTWCSPDDLPEAINDREEWRERVRDIRAGGTTWWWWSKYMCRLIYVHICMHIKKRLFICIYIYIYMCVCVVWLLFNAIVTLVGYLMPKPSF